MTGWKLRGALVTAVTVLIATQAGEAAVAQGSATLRTREERREKEQRVADIFTALGVGPGTVIADIGAGQGFFTVRLAAAVGETGRVLAVDVSSSVLRSLRTRVEDEGLKNVEVIEGATDDPKLPAATLDAALIVNAYHEMTEHQAMLDHIRKALKPGGRLVIVEPISSSRRDATREAQTRQHEIGPEFVQQEAKAAGYAIATVVDPFSNHHGHGSEYMIVLIPAPPGQGGPSSGMNELPRR